MVDMVDMADMADTVARVTPSPEAKTECYPLRNEGLVINTDALNIGL